MVSFHKNCEPALPPPIRRWLKIAWVTGMIGIILSVTSGAAFAALAISFPPPRVMEQKDADTDGRPDQVTWLADYNQETFRITVLDGGSDMLPSNTWQEVSDFRNDTWLFDRLDDGQIDLVIQFREDPSGSLSARLWDDQNGDGQVKVDLATGIAVVRESVYPSLVIQTTGDWTLLDGAINPNLEFNYDGVAPNLDFVTQDVVKVLDNLVKIDGQPDFQVKIVDTDQDGRIDFSHNQILSAIPNDYGVWRHTMKVNSSKRSSPPVEEAFYWPLLNFQAIYDYKNYFDTPAYVDINWKRAKIADFGITGYPVEQGYHINNLNPWEKDRLNQVNFENMMAYYDLAANQDGLPELFIRHVYWPSIDSLYIPNPSRPVNEIRYSWRVRDTHRINWDYGLSLLGSNPITSTVTYGEFPLQLVPHPELPGWVLDRTWVNATLVTTETRDYLSTEGIYEWSTLEGVVNDINLPPGDPNRFVKDSHKVQASCLTGGGSCDLSALYTNIGTGMRAEYGQIDASPRLFRSPIDRRLHLTGLDLGVWRLDEQNLIRYYDRSGDGYADLWQHESNGIIFSTLAWTPDYLFLASFDQLAIKKISLPATDYETRPPIDHQTWQAMVQALALDPARLPGNLQAMFDQFPGEVQRITQVQKFVAEQAVGGMRFLTELSPNHRSQGPVFLDLEQISSGEYLITPGQALAIAPIRPSEINLSLLPLRESLLTGQPGELILVVSNRGDLEATGRVVVEMQQDSQPLKVLDQALSLYADQQRQVLVSWQPPMEGAWQLTARFENPAGDPIANLSQTYSVLANPGTIRNPLLSRLTLTLVVLFAAAFIVLTGLLTNRLEESN